MKPTQRRRGLQTQLIHTADAANPTSAVTPPIFQTSTFRLATPEEGAALAASTAPAMFYGRDGTPNVRQVELLLAELDGAEAALAVGSGMAAITIALMANLRAGDHVVAQQTHYTSTLVLLAQTLPQFGVEVTQVDQRDPANFAAALRPNTKVVYTESPTNPTLALTDLAATAEIAHAAGALAITDNTFASSYNQRPLALGYDLVVHSATKYLNGHADVLAGVITGSRARMDHAWEYLMTYGPVLHPFDAWLLRRGLLTYGLRMAAHNQNALAVARFLDAHPAVKGGYEAAYRVIGRTEICVLAVSLGGVETLITHPASMVHTRQTDAERDTAGIPAGLIRLSVGIENVEDIIADLDQALS
jgi:cystathionine beta-lyase/cystathionine gamma-synthase